VNLWNIEMMVDTVNLWNIEMMVDTVNLWHRDDGDWIKHGTVMEVEGIRQRQGSHASWKSHGI